MQRRKPVKRPQSDARASNDSSGAAANAGEARPFDVEQADVAAGTAGRAAGIVALARHGLSRVEFSIVNGHAIFEGDIDLGPSGVLTATAKAIAISAGE